VQALLPEDKMKVVAVMTEDWKVYFDNCADNIRSIVNKWGAEAGSDITPSLYEQCARISEAWRKWKEVQDYREQYGDRSPVAIPRRIFEKALHQNPLTHHIIIDPSNDPSVDLNSELCQTIVDLHKPGRSSILPVMYQPHYHMLRQASPYDHYAAMARCVAHRLMIILCESRSDPGLPVPGLGPIARLLADYTYAVPSVMSCLFPSTSAGAAIDIDAVYPHSLGSAVYTRVREAVDELRRNAPTITSVGTNMPAPGLSGYASAEAALDSIRAAAKALNFDRVFMLIDHVNVNVALRYYPCHSLTEFLRTLLNQEAAKLLAAHDIYLQAFLPASLAQCLWPD
jgi:hypothetical protein